VFVKDVDLEAMPTSIFLNDDDNDVGPLTAKLRCTVAVQDFGIQSNPAVTECE